jgi:hypothetical protein
MDFTPENRSTFAEIAVKLAHKQVFFPNDRADVLDGCAEPDRCAQCAARAGDLTAGCCEPVLERETTFDVTKKWEALSSETVLGDSGLNLSEKPMLVPKELLLPHFIREWSGQASNTAPMHPLTTGWRSARGNYDDKLGQSFP